jgi:hypothetical protein
MLKRTRLLFISVAFICLVSIGCTGTPTDFNKVVLTPSATKIGPSGQVTITAVVPRDTTNAGVNWAFTPGAGAPANPGTFVVVSPSEAQYSAPTNVPSQFTVSIQGTSIALPTEANSITITVQTAQPLAITTTTLPTSTANVAYPNTQLQATGGVPPYTWTLTSAASTFPPGLTLASDGTISGTPTTVGVYNFTVQVADSESTPMTQSANLSITIANLLNGQYSFEFSGFNSQGAVVVAGTFTADGAGNITDGVEDYNTITGPPVNRTFTGTYTLSSDNRGTLTLTSLPGSPVYAFALDSTGAHARMIELDSSGVRGSGQIEQRTVTGCAFNTINGNYAFGLTGQETAFGGNQAGPAVIVGSFLATAPASASGQGTIGPGEADSNVPGLVTEGDGSLSGIYQTTTQSTRCQFGFANVNAGIGAMNFSAYPVSNTEVFLVETDAVNSTTSPYLTVGKMLMQSGLPFGAAGSTFTATSVGGLTGQFYTGTTYVPDLALVSLTGTTSASYTMNITENQGGTTAVYTPATPTFQEADQYGRLLSGISSPIAPVFYIIQNNEAFAIGEIINDPFFGILEPQSGSPFSASQLNSTFAFGTAAPTTVSVPNYSGEVTLANTSTTAGNINGLEDISTSGSNTSGATVTGTYSSLNSALGSGTIALTAPVTLSGRFLIVSPTKFIVMTTTNGDTTPQIVFFGNCQDTCGEN